MALAFAGPSLYCLFWIAMDVEVREGREDSRAWRGPVHFFPSLFLPCGGTVLLSGSHTSE